MNGRSLLLNGLLIGIPPGADLEASADPAQPLVGVGRASRTADRAFVDALDLVVLDSALGFFEQRLVDHGLVHRQQFPFHRSKPSLA